MLHPKGSTKCICGNGDFNNCGQDTFLVVKVLDDPNAKSWFEEGLRTGSYEKIKKSISNGVLKNLETKTDTPVPDAATPPAVPGPQEPLTTQYTGQLGLPARAQSAKGEDIHRSSSGFFDSGGMHEGHEPDDGSTAICSANGSADATTVIRQLHARYTRTAGSASRCATTDDAGNSQREWSTEP